MSAWRLFVVAALGAGAVLAAFRSSAPSRVIVRPPRSARHLHASSVAHATLVAAVHVEQLQVYRRPGARRSILVLGRRAAHGGPRVLLVKALRGAWVQVWLPVRPNGSTGWVRTNGVTLARDDWQVLVHLRRHRLVVFRDGRELWSTRVAAGAAGTPTPRGHFFVTELLRQPDPRGAYGPWVFALSGFSQVLTRFRGGDGELGIHGTDQPALLGHDVSHGCVRVDNRAIDRLVQELPLGTPVDLAPR